MGKPKSAKKKPDAAGAQTGALHETKDSPSPVVELVYQSETNAFVASGPEVTGTKGEQPTGADGAEKTNGSAETQVGVVEDTSAQHEAGSDEQKPATDSDNGHDRTQKPALYPVVIDRPDVLEAASTKEELSSAKIDEIVHKVMANHKKAESFSLETGLLILVLVFCGRMEEAQSRNPRKNRSFSAICRHPDMKVDATTLSRWVQAANLVKIFEAAGRAFRNLTCSHYIALLPLEKLDTQLRLAEEADEGQSSVRNLAKKVRKLIPPAPRSLLKSIKSKLSNPKELAKEEKSLLDKKIWAELSAEDRKTLMTRVANEKVSAQTYLNQLARFGRLLEEIAEEDE